MYNFMLCSAQAIVISPPHPTVTGLQYTSRYKAILCHLWQAVVYMWAAVGEGGYVCLVAQYNI